MSGLAHYLEDEHIATVVIALVREHAEQMQPSRALWVPFMLGRPFGAPNNPDLQTQVLRQALALLDVESGPILADAEIDDDREAQQDGNWVCPVSFPSDHKESSDLSTRVIKELSELRSWYELGVERRGRTSVGLSPISVGDSVRLIACYINEPEGTESSDQMSAGNSLRWSASDVKSYYWEAITAQPGSTPAHHLENWFWKQTAAGELLLQLRAACLAHKAKEIRDVGLYMIG